MHLSLAVADWASPLVGLSSSHSRQLSPRDRQKELFHVGHWQRHPAHSDPRVSFRLFITRRMTRESCCPAAPTTWLSSTVRPLSFVLFGNVASGLVSTDRTRCQGLNAASFRTSYSSSFAPSEPSCLCVFVRSCASREFGLDPIIHWSMMSLKILSLLTLLLPLVLAHSTSSMDSMAGMDTSGDTTLMSGMMVPYLHFTPGDILLFEGWVPKSVGAMVGACIGLFMLALIDRWLAAMRRVMEGHWARRAQVFYARKNRDSSSEVEALKSEPGALKSVVLRSAPPFVLGNDLARGAMHALQSALSFTFMLAAMTFQVGFILSIIIGMGVGETLFGRFGTHGLGSAH